MTAVLAYVFLGVASALGSGATVTLTIPPVSARMALGTRP